MSRPRQCFLGRRLRQCFLQLSGNTLQQVETLKYLGMVFTSCESRYKGIDTRIGKGNAVLREFIAPWWPNGSFQRTQSFHFLNRSLFRSSPMVMNFRWRLKECCQKNERQRWDICEEFSVWHLVTKSTGLKPRMSSHFSESRDPSYVHSAKCPKCPRKEWRTKSFRLQSTLHPRESGPKFVQWPGGVTSSPTLIGPPWCGASRTIWDCCWSRVFRVLLGLLLPWLSPKEKRARKWENEWVFRPTLNLSICKIVFCLFAESDCLIQIIKHIWMETCVLYKTRKNASDIT